MHRTLGFALAWILALGAGAHPAAAEDELPWERGALWGGFVFRVEAGPDRVLAHTTGGSFLRPDGTDRWTRIDRPGQGIRGPVRLLAGKLWCEQDGVVRVRNDKTGKWEIGPAIGGRLHDAVVLPGERPEVLWSSLRPDGADEWGPTTVLVTRGSETSRPIGAVPRSEGGWPVYRHLAVRPSDPGRVRLIIPLRQPEMTHVFGRDEEDGAWSHWTLPFFLTDIVAAPPEPGTWAGIALPAATGGGPLGLVRSDDGGHTWREAGADTRLRRLRTLAVRPDTGALLLGAFDGAVLETSDLGKTLAVRREGGGADNVTSIAVVRGHPDRIRIGTQAGLYRTDDGGKTWAWSVRGMTAIQSTGLVAGTDGRVLAFDFHQGPRISEDRGRTFVPYDSSFKGRHGRVFAVRSGGTTIALDLSRIGGASTCLVSRDSGRTWSRTEGDFARRWILGVLSDATVYAWDESEGLLRMTEALGWRPVPGVGTDLPITPTLVFGAPDGRLLLAALDGLLLLDPEKADLRQQVSLPKGARVPLCHPDPAMPSVFYVSAGAVWQGNISKPGWAEVFRTDGELLVSLVGDPGKPERRVAGFSRGTLAVSEDAGGTWRRFAGSRFQVVNALAVGPDRRLYVVADGGLHVLPLSALDGD